MTSNSVTSTSMATKGKFIYGQEALLIIFAAILLIAAVPPKTPDTAAEVILLEPHSTTKPLSTASVKITDEIQTTAFLALEEPSQTKVTP